VTALSPRNQAHHNVARNRQVKTGLWTVLSLSLAFVGVLMLSTIDTPNGEPWLESSAIAQTLTTLGLVAAAILPSLLGTRKDSAVVREQVENSHVTNPDKISNVRDDMDSKHEEIRDLIEKHTERMEARFNGMASDIRGVRRDIGRSSDAITELQTDHKHLRDNLVAVKDDVKSLRATHIGVDRETGTIHIVTDVASPEQGHEDGK
jgi:hypothetical protein